MNETLYRRPLPADAIAFSSPEGRQLFAEALAAGGLGGYFPLAEQFHTQSDPAFCGLGSLVVALNALSIDPGRLWKGPWRWFSEEMLDCCVPLTEVQQRGLALDELACLARCNGAEVVLQRADGHGLPELRAALATAARGDAVLIASYDRAALGQTGRGHFSPLGGYHPTRDLVLVLDVARFKYPPHWVPAERLWAAMRPLDPATGEARGWMVLRRRKHGLALGFSLKCEGESWRVWTERLRAALDALDADAEVSTLARALRPFVSSVELRAPSAPLHQQALASARAELRELAARCHVAEAVGEEHAEAVTLLLLAATPLFTPAQRGRLDALASAVASDGSLGAELSNVQSQLMALWAHAQPR